MIVYCSTFGLRLDTQLDDVCEVIADWIGRKGREPFSVEQMMNSAVSRLNHISVETEKSIADYPFKASIRVTHGDAHVRGRQWSTEIGLRQDEPSHAIHCSVLLETKDVSTRVTEAVEVTRPLVVLQLIERFGHPAFCPGQMGVLLLTANKVADFQHLLESPERRHPIVVLSCKGEAGGYYYVNPQDICSQTIGLADTYVIPADEDNWHIAKVLGRRHSTWNGAINILFPVINRADGPIIPNQLILPEMLDSLLADGRRLDTEVLAVITHHANLPNARNHLSPEKVQQSNLLYRVESARQEAAKTGTLDERVELLEELFSIQSKDNSKLQAESEMLQQELSVKDDEARQLEFTVKNLEQNLAKAKMVSSSKLDLTTKDLDFLRRAILQEPTPELALQIVNLLFSDRLLVLKSAWESAQQSSEYRYGKRVFELLWLLATCYWEAVSRGVGDVDARKCFGNAYAAKESETVMKNRSARAKRRFVLEDGQEIVMEKHLKNGVKDSIADTIRIHFEWLPDLNKIVIGHCGPHIDFG